MRGKPVLASYDVFVNIFKFLNETVSLFGSFHVVWLESSESRRKITFGWRSHGCYCSVSTECNKVTVSGFSPHLGLSSSSEVQCEEEVSQSRHSAAYTEIKITHHKCNLLLF